MEPYQQRVIDEHNELSEKISKLEKFLITDAYEHLNAEEKGLLHRQRHAMQVYRGVLAERIEWSLPMKHDMTIEVTLNNASNRGRMVSMFADILLSYCDAMWEERP